MTDTRQVLEEAWDKIHPMPELSDIVSRDEFLMAMEVSWPARSRFRRFLDAEAWTDAALCLVPQGWSWMVRDDGLAVTLRKKGNEDGCYSSLDGFTERAKTPALAIAQAALRAQEAGDV